MHEKWWEITIRKELQTYFSVLTYINFSLRRDLHSLQNRRHYLDEFKAKFK